jgi:hypothetical protein
VSYSYPVFVFILTLILSDRTQRLKDARSEAAKDLETYKAKKEADLKEFEAKVRQ